MRTSKSLKTQKSMTLVEVMVSIMLITLLTGSILGVVIENIKLGETLDYNYAATNIAKSRIDRIRELRRDKGYSSLNTAAESNVTVDRNGLPDVDGDFTRSTTITTNFDGNANLTQVVVTVNYQGRGDVSTTTITLTTLMSPFI